MMKFPWLFNDILLLSTKIPLLVNEITTVNPDEQDQIIFVLMWSVIKNNCFVIAIKTFHE